VAPPCAGLCGHLPPMSPDHEPEIACVARRFEGPFRSRVRWDANPTTPAVTPLASDLHASVEPGATAVHPTKRTLSIASNGALICNAGDVHSPEKPILWLRELSESGCFRHADDWYKSCCIRQRGLIWGLRRCGHAHFSMQIKHFGCRVGGPLPGAVRDVVFESSDSTCRRRRFRRYSPH
jgi:hypothetical protein